MRYKRRYIWILLIFIMFSIPQIAYGHAYIVSSNPSENEVLKEAPENIKIEFNEAVQEGFLSVKVKDGTGKQVDKGNAHIDSTNKNVVLIDIEKDISDGTYFVEWSVVSADGHQVSGVISFSVGSINAVSSTQEKVESRELPAIDIIFDRVVLYTGLSLYAGFLLFGLVLHRDRQQAEKLFIRSKRMMNLALICIGISLLYALPMQTIENTNGSWFDGFKLSLIKETLQNTLGGKIWVIQIFLYILLVTMSYKCISKKKLSSFRAWWFPTFLFISLLGTKAFIGHANSSEYRLLTIPMDFLHLATASIWIGGVMSIVYLWRKDVVKDEKDYWILIQRFAPWAMGAVIMLMFSGFINAILYLPSINLLFNNIYGQVLLIKIILVIIILIFGWVHHKKARLGKGTSMEQSGKKQVIIGISIFIAASILVNIPTPQVASKQSNSYEETVSLETGDKVSLKVTPNQSGKNLFHVTIKDKGGKPVKEIQQVTITLYDLSVEGEQMGIEFRVLETEEGTFEGESLNITEEGVWHIKVHGLTKELENIDAEFHIGK